MNELQGVRAIVTGGASGSGLATASLLAARGAEVAVLDLDPSNVHKPLHAFNADFSDNDSVRASVTAAAAIAFLASPLAGSPTGTALAVDGGMAPASGRTVAAVQRPRVAGKTPAGPRMGCGCLSLGPVGPS